MATVVKATEHVLVETATAVVSSLGAAATAEFKTLESGIAQEVVSATDDGVSNILHKVEDALETVAEEVYNGAKHVVEAVKQHPELIAEGALAVAIGVASLVQPELIAGEVAILGKMAADSAKKTVTQIASDEGEKIVKAISKDLAEDAKAEAEKDKLQAEEKKKAEGGEVVADGETAKVAVPEGAEVKPVTEGDKTISIEIEKPAANTEGIADVKTEKDAAPVQLKITIGSDGEIKAVSKSVTEEAKPVEKAAEVGIAASAVTATSLDVSKEIPAISVPATSISTDPKAAETKEASPVKPEQFADSPPVTKEVAIPITQEGAPAKPEVLPTGITPAVQEEPVKEGIKGTELLISKPVDETAVKTEAEPSTKASETPSPLANPPVETTISKTKQDVEPEILSVLGIIHNDVIEVPSKVAAVDAQEKTGLPDSERADSFVEQLLHRSNSGEPVVPVDQLDERPASGPQPASVESVPALKQEPAASITATEELTKEEIVGVQTPSEGTDAQPPGITQSEQISVSGEAMPTTPTEPTQQDVPGSKSKSPESRAKPVDDRNSPLPSALSQAKDLAASALASNTTESGSELVTATASVTNIITTTTKTVEVPSSPGVKMVTVSQESLDILHSKLDAMHEAIQLITKTLATHLPAPPAPPAPAPVVVKAVEVETIPVPITQATPEHVVTPVAVTPEPKGQETETPKQAQSSTTPTTTDQIAPVPTSSTNPPEAQPTTPKRPTHVKRGSVIGSIGKFLWPFGGSAPPPSKDAAVTVSTVEVSSEVEAEVQRPRTKSSGRDSAPGLGVTKAVSTVEVTEVLAMPMAA